MDRMPRRHTRRHRAVANRQSQKIQCHAFASVTAMPEMLQASSTRNAKHTSRAAATTALIAILAASAQCRLLRMFTTATLTPSFRLRAPLRCRKRHQPLFLLTFTPN